MKKRLQWKCNSDLVIYTDQSNQPHVEVVTKFPNKSFWDHTSTGFSGFLTKDDWAGNRIQTVKYENGKAFVKSVNGQAPDSKTVNSFGIKSNFQTCWYLAHYTCYETTIPDTYSCELVDTEFVGCEGEKYDELVDGSGEGDIEVTDASLEATRVWPVKEHSDSVAGIYWTLWSTDVFTGSRPSGSVAIFTGNKSHTTSLQAQAGFSHTQTGFSCTFSQQNTHVALAVTAFITLADFGSGTPFTGNASGDASALFP